MKTPFSQMCLLPVFCSSAAPTFGKHIKIALEGPHPTGRVAVIKGYKDEKIGNAICFEVEPDPSIEQLNFECEKFHIEGYLNQELDQQLNNKWTPLHFSWKLPRPKNRILKWRFFQSIRMKSRQFFR